MSRKIDTDSARERGQRERRLELRPFDKCPFTNPKLKAAWQDGWRITDRTRTAGYANERR